MTLPSEPLDAAARLTGRPGRVVLASGSDDDGVGRWSFVACEPELVVAARGRRVVVRAGDGEVVWQGEADPLEVVAARAREAGAEAVCRDDAPVPVAIGYLGYDLARVLEPNAMWTPARASFAPALPDLWFGIYGAVWRGDRASGRAEIVGPDAGARERLARSLAASPPRSAPPVFGELAAADDAADFRAYRQRFERVRSYLRAGDVYQVNLARRLAAPIERDGDALALLAALSACAPAPYAALLETSEGRVLSASPERFLAKPSGSRRLETRPIKGTRRRAGVPERDRAAAAELASDPKERAEHLMIVDLERNDLGRIAETGSVRVESFARVVELPTLYHLVSTIACTVREGVGAGDILRATFPSGSITGAPKVRAMEIIDELEPARRGIYTGAIGYLGMGGAIDLSIAIRTAVLAAEAVHIHVGGGIVMDSRADRELEETEEKAAAWRRAFAALPTLQGTSAREGGLA